MPPISTPDGIAAAIRELAQADKDADLSMVTQAVERAETERRERIETALKGVVDLETLKGSSLRRFVVAYWYRGKAGIAEGIEYPVQRNDDGVVCSAGISIRDDGHPFFWGHYTTMEEFRNFFVGRKMPYHLTYFD